MHSTCKYLKQSATFGLLAELMLQSTTSGTLQWHLKMTGLHCGKIYSIRCRVVTVMLMSLFLLYFIYFANIPLSELFFLIPGTRPNIYGIMFDAGSTGSRIHVFTFVKAKGELSFN